MPLVKNAQHSTDTTGIRNSHTSPHTTYETDARGRVLRNRADDVTQ